ncbi:MAG: UDP-glucose 4-epimerase GalE [Alphaproteobacteria bacterium]|nr:MAG: UDP-glucose 4-epimerase GalE [Alphaproteobacteria bacterium]
MTVLVTGGAGYIGSHMTWALKDLEQDVVVLDNLSTGVPDFLPSDIELIEGSVGDKALLYRIFKQFTFDSVVHFAGSVIVPESVENPLKYYENNTANSRTLIEAAVEHKTPRFLFSSTAAVYGNSAETFVSEETPVAPACPYATSKLMTEWMLRDAAAVHPLRYVALRYFNVAGADPEKRTGQSTPNATHLIKRATQTALGQWDDLQVFGDDYDTKDGTGVRDYIHVSDLVQAHLNALNYLSEGGPSAVFNCGYGHGYSVLDVVHVVEKITGRPLPVKHVPRRPGDSAEITANNRRLVEALQWQPKFDNLELIVRSAFEWEAKLAQKDVHAAE